MDTLIENKKSFFKRFWWIFIILGIGLAVFAFAAIKGYLHDLELEKMQNTDNQNKEKYKQKGMEPPFGWPSVDAKYITAVPLDLTQIKSISKYRSCAGHDRAGYSFEKTYETDRSMKHYIYPVQEFQGTTNKVKMFAPFDGTINSIQIVNDEDPAITYIYHIRLNADGISFYEYNSTRPAEPRIKMGNDIDIATDVDKNVMFGFRHVAFARDFKVGDKVKAGELIGYASIAEKQNDFDIDLVGKVYYKTENGTQIEVLGSIFDHMTDPVLVEFAKYGLTPENTKFSKEYRDANTCGYGADKYGSTACREDSEDKDGAGRNNDCWVQLEH